MNVFGECAKYLIESLKVNRTLTELIGIPHDIRMQGSLEEKKEKQKQVQEEEKEVDDETEKEEDEEIEGEETIPITKL